MECNNCNSGDIREVYTVEYGGHKRARSRDDTEKVICVCNACGGHGRKYIDGVDGGVQLTGVLRE